MGEILEFISDIISIISIFVVVYGTVVATISFIRNEFFRVQGRFNSEQIRFLRVHLGSYILLGLELLIASDILKTVVEPGLTELGILGGVVLLRTILSFFLNKEILEIDKERNEMPDLFETRKAE